MAISAIPFSLKFKAFLRMARPFFLLEGVSLYLLGVGIAYAAGAPFNVLNFILGQLLVTSTQLMTHFSNEYFDREVDCVSQQTRTWFSGGSGVLPAGILSQRVALWSAISCALVAGVTLITLLFISPWVSLLGLVGALAAWFYSAPPLRLVARGWGELTSSLIVALYVPLAGAALQIGINAIPPVFWFICLPLVMIHTATMIATELPDRKGDAIYCKNNLPVQMGLVKAAWLHNGLMGLTFVLYGLFILIGSISSSGWLVFLALPLAIWQMVRVIWQVHHPQAGFFWMMNGTIGLMGLTGVLWLLAIWI
jgi:1,4-dihydroxy-2-naphthoate octaprenyltransferase